jgi:hypothetical protein
MKSTTSLWVETGELKPRQKRAVEAFVGPAKGQKKQALLMAGYPASVASHQAHREWTPNMAAYARQLLDREGITDQVLVRKHRILLDAKRHVFGPKGKLHRFADNDVQARMVQLGYQVKGLFKPDTDTARIVTGLVEAFGGVMVEFVPREKQRECFKVLEDRLVGVVEPPRVG